MATTAFKQSPVRTAGELPATGSSAPAFDLVGTDLAAVTALTHCLVEHLSTLLDEGQDLPTLPPWYVRENKWRSARYGLDATIITDRDGTQRQVTDDIRDLVDSLAPVAARLGCAEELASILAIVSLLTAAVSTDVVVVMWSS